MRRTQRQNLVELHECLQLTLATPPMASLSLLRLS
jgi:hypothetical protein